jgi:hypothetical protein
VERADDPVTGDFVEEVWVGFHMPHKAGRTGLPSQPEWALAVLAAMVPVPFSLSDLDFGGTFPRHGGSAPNEITSVGGRSSYGPSEQGGHPTSSEDVPPAGYHAGNASLPPRDNEGSARWLTATGG